MKMSKSIYQGDEYGVLVTLYGAAFGFVSYCVHCQSKNAGYTGVVDRYQGESPFRIVNRIRRAVMPKPGLGFTPAEQVACGPVARSAPARPPSTPRVLFAPCPVNTGWLTGTVIHLGFLPLAKLPLTIVVKMGWKMITILFGSHGCS
jgi:hypothetical protein